jgi:hypothetical protein
VKRLGRVLVILTAACSTTAHDVRRDAMTRQLEQHRFAMTLEQAQAMLTAQTTWPGQPFGTWSVKLEAQPHGGSRVRIPVTLLNNLTTGRPNDLAVIELAQEPGGLRAQCTYEQSDADCADWVWKALSHDGLDEARGQAAAAADKLAMKEQRRETRRLEKQTEVTARAEAAHEEVFKPAWAGTFHFGLALGGNDTGAMGAVMLRGGFRRLHSAHLATAYLLEYELSGHSARPGGGWVSLVVPQFHVELAFLTSVFTKAPMAYVTLGPVAVIDIDNAPGSGGGLRGGLGFRADYYFVEAYVQRWWTTGGTGGEWSVLGALGIGF